MVGVASLGLELTEKPRCMVLGGHPGENRA